jgi:class 3 adenylate cyclase
MTTEPQEEVVRSYAKYIFLDVVKFSQRSAEAQSAIVRELNTIILNVLTQHGVCNEDRILIPTGDGTCITLVSPALPYDAHIQISLTILEKLHAYNQDAATPNRQFEVRIGINQNTDILVTDINDKPNMAGAGINMASRIMDKSGPNQILVSQTVYDELQPSERYMNKFRAFETESKHDLKFRAFQYIGEGHVGLNREIPTDFKETPAAEPKLSKEAAYYFAHAIKLRPFIVNKQGHGQANYNLTLMLWFFAKDSVGESEATEIEPYEPDIYGKGKVSLEDIFEYYNRVDFNVIFALGNFIARELRPYRKFCESGMGFLPVFVTEDGAAKLKREWPEIWKSFELDNSNTTP